MGAKEPQAAPVSAEPRRADLGDLVTDAVTGYQGVVVGITRWITGCDQATVQSGKINEQGKLADSHWFDVTRLRVDTVGHVKLPGQVMNSTAHAAVDKPGGPHPGY